jgi:hypothetical protein
LKRAGVKKDVRPCICLYIDSIFTWIVTRPCGPTAFFRLAGAVKESRRTAEESQTNFTLTPTCKANHEYCILWNKLTRSSKYMVYPIIV